MRICIGTDALKIIVRVILAYSVCNIMSVSGRLTYDELHEHTKCLVIMAKEKLIFLSPYTFPNEHNIPPSDQEPKNYLLTI